MARQERPATPKQVKAAASSTRLRILRLCDKGDLTNQQLAARLGRDPSTILHHTRLLVAAGLLEGLGVRQGSSGAYEKPYRTTGLHRQLRFDTAPVDEDDDGGELAMLNAFHEALDEAGADSIAELTLFHLHLDDQQRDAFIYGIKDLIFGLVDEDPFRRQNGSPGYGGMFILHRLAPPAATSVLANR